MKNENLQNGQNAFQYSFPSIDQTNTKIEYPKSCLFKIFDVIGV